MASSIPISRFGIYSSVCKRCSTLLATSSRAPQKRRLPALTTQQRGISSGRTSLSPRDSYEAPSWASRRHDASSGLLYPGSTRRATTSTTSYNASLLRGTPRSHFSTTSIVAESAASSPAQSARPEPPDYLDEKERAIFDRLNEELQPIELQVEDISGGCGSMYAVAITAEKFKGLPVIKQHRLVNQILGEDIKSWHGIQLRTKAP